MDQGPDKYESAEAQLNVSHKSSDPIRRETWFRRLKDWIWGYDFFISYHWASGGSYAVNLAARMRERGYDVFLDRAEYAMGDAWKPIGEIALCNTHCLVLIATREAVFESKPVEHEIVMFTNRSRHCIPIVFGDTFAKDERESHGDSIVLDRLTADTLYIEDSLENLPIGPVPDVIEKLAAAHGTMRRRQVRQNVTIIAVSSLVAFSILASVSWMNARFARDEAIEARDVSEERLSEVYLQNGYRGIHQDRDVVTGVLWYSKAMTTSGERAAPLRDSARSLIGGWSGFLPQHSFVHDAPLLDVSFSRDGLTIATCGSDETARLWDARTGQPLGEPLKHDLPVRVVAFSSDGHTLATGCADFGLRRGESRLWDIHAGKPLGEPLKHDLPVRAVSFSPNGQTLATASGNFAVGEQRGEARLWDCRTGQPLSEPLKHNGPVIATVFSPDGRMFATASEDHTARLWDAWTGQPHGEPLKHGKPVNAISFSQDSQTLAAADSDKLVILWDVSTGKQRGDPLKHGGSVVAISFSPDGRTLATASEIFGEEQRVVTWTESSGQPLGAVLLWDVLSGRPRGTPLKHERRVNAMSFSPNGRLLATVSDDKTAEGGA
ncbi:MAG TPA: TIR domain-containing protein [Planctomycetaceae bacterium]|nr:TIR domain-containing protein [Planctomycetaceae bacterium]